MDQKGYGADNFIYKVGYGKLTAAASREGSSTVPESSIVFSSKAIIKFDSPPKTIWFWAKSDGNVARWKKGRQFFYTGLWGLARFEGKGSGLLTHFSFFWNFHVS